MAFWNKHMNKSTTVQVVLIWSGSFELGQMRGAVQFNNWSLLQADLAIVTCSCTLISWSPFLKARLKLGLVYVATWRTLSVNELPTSLNVCM